MTFVLKAILYVALAICSWTLVSVIAIAFLNPADEAVWWFLRTSVISGLIAGVASYLLLHFERE